MALLFHDVSMEIVFKLLGHSNMNVTQAPYGKGIQKKMSEAMNTLLSKKTF
jgi:hypothetical protein